jgi:60S ribosome subunit biogenesis protein NIP7
MWLKTSAEQQFLYGHNVMKSGLGRISESVDRYQGVILYSMNDLPLVSLEKINNYSIFG